MLCLISNRLHSAARKSNTLKYALSNKKLEANLQPKVDIQFPVNGKRIPIKVTILALHIGIAFSGGSTMLFDQAQMSAHNWNH